MSRRWKVFFLVHVAISGVAAWLLYGRGVAWAAGMVLIQPLMVLLAHRIWVARPLRSILDGAERLADGVHNNRIRLEGNDDLAAVATALNRMAEQVASTQRDLERKVSERTEDLRAVLEEVHERSRIAEEVSLRLADADKRKASFLTNVSHELRTPLNSIIGFLRLIQDGVYESDAERNEYLENARQSADHLLHLINDVLGVARLEEGHADVRLEMIHPGDVICEVLRLLDAQIREKNLSVRLEVEGKFLVAADPAKLRQVLVNLIGNALRFTDAGSVTIRARPDGKKVRFEVEDTGVGIPPSDLDKIFTKFHQVAAHADRNHGGTGLGLAISRELIILMGGRIGATSDGPGKGTLVHFTLPGVRDVAEAHEPDRAANVAKME